MLATSHVSGYQEDVPSVTISDVLSKKYYTYKNHLTNIRERERYNGNTTYLPFFMRHPPLSPAEVRAQKFLHTLPSKKEPLGE